MLSAIVLAALVSQCPGGACALPPATYQLSAPAYAAFRPGTHYRLIDRNGRVWNYMSQPFAPVPVAQPRYFYPAPQFTAPAFTQGCSGGRCGR